MRRTDWGRKKRDDLQARSRRRLLRDLKASVPGLLVSVALHAALLFLCTLFYIRLTLQQPALIDLDWARAVQNPSSGTEQVAPVVVPLVNTSRPPDQPNPNKASAQTSAPTIAATPNIAPVGVAQALELRKDRNRRAMLHIDEAKGKEDPLDMALHWLSQQQHPDGRWGLQGPYDDGGMVETFTGATSLALLCFLGDGQTHQTGEHQATVERGLKWLVSHQRPNGDLFDIPEEGKEAHFYSHSQATMALCEAIALTGDDSLRPAAEQAVQFLVRAQNPALGGWKYRPLTETGMGDLSVTGWALMALHSARMAQVEVPPEAFLLASRFLDSVQERTGDAARYKYRPDFDAEEAQRWSMTAEGLLCRQWLGWPKTEPALARGDEYLTSARCEPSWGPNRRNVYAWYYTAQMLHNLGGERWESWFRDVSALLIANQQRTGKVKGSWHPYRPPGAFQERSRDGGRLYLTAMCVLILETPFRHAPLYAPVPSAQERSQRRIR